MKLFSDRYEIQQQLGKKAGRQTWLARDLHTQALVVIKLLSFSHDFEWDDLKLFEREAATLQALDHAAIPQYLDFFEFDFDDFAEKSLRNRKGFALVQSYIEAKSLEQHLKSGRSFTEAEVEQLAKDLLGILAYLHDRQPPVIHRDIKPSNVLLTDRSGNSPGRIHLVDFGSVQTLAAKEGGTITVVGTYGYMPPEQFGGRATPASDLYSLGATLIYLITGQHPADLPQEDLKIQFAPIVSISPGFASWLKWLTQPSLNNRPSSVKQALQGLEERRSLRDTRKGSHSATVIEKPIAKPTDTKITLIKDADAIEVILPSQRVALVKSSPQISSLYLAIALVFLLPASLFFIQTGLLLFALLSPIGLALLARIFMGLAKAEFVINEREVYLTRRFFRFRYTPPSSTKRRYAWRLTLSYERLDLWVGTQRFEFSGTPEEMSWLAYELSDWLRLPIERE